jgi:hypothetical protein
MIDINEIYWKTSSVYGKIYAKITAIDLLSQTVYYNWYRGDTHEFVGSKNLTIRQFVSNYPFKLDFLPSWLK